MKHWRHRARAVLAVTPTQVQGLSNFQEHLAKPTHLVRFSRLRPTNFQVLLSRTTPANGTTIVGLNVNRNAAFRQSRRLGQRDATIDFVAVCVLRDRCSVVEVFSAKTFVAMVLREHSLAFTVIPPLKLTSNEIFDVIIWKKYETIMKLSTTIATLSTTCHKRFSSDSSYRVRIVWRNTWHLDWLDACRCI